MAVNKSKEPSHVAACTFALQRSGDGAIQIFPAGTFDAPRGALAGAGPWTLNDASAAALIAKTAQRINPLVVDYEHQTLLTAQNGQPAPAAGWIAAASLEWRADGLWATACEWTARAAAMIVSDEYKFLSPVFRYDRQTGAPLELLSVALTNNPAIDGMAAVAAATAALSNPTPETPAMDMSEIIERLCYLLNLPITSTAEEIGAQLDKLKAMITASPTAAATGLFGLLESQGAQIAALTSATPDPAKYVPLEVHVQTQNDLAALTAKVENGERDALMTAALSDGRILPAQEAYWRGQPLAALTAYLDVAQPIAALVGTQTGGKAPEGGSTETLTADQLAICSQMGVSVEDFKATLAAQV